MGFLNVKSVGQSGVESILRAREQGGPFYSLADAMQRTGLQRDALENLVMAGTFGSLVPDRRAALWEVGLRYRPVGIQQVLPLPVEQDSADLSSLSEWEAMLAEYRTMGLYPKGHFMAHVRPHLGPQVLSSDQVWGLKDGTEVTVVGLVIRRQRPGANAIFITLEDEFGHTPLIIWPKVFERYRLVIKEPVLKAQGFVSRRDDSMNVVVTQVESLRTVYDLPKAKNWG